MAGESTGGSLVFTTHLSTWIIQATFAETGSPVLGLKQAQKHTHWDTGPNTCTICSKAFVRQIRFQHARRQTLWPVHVKMRLTWGPYTTTLNLNLFPKSCEFHWTKTSVAIWRVFQKLRWGFRQMSDLTVKTFLTNDETPWNLHLTFGTGQRDSGTENNRDWVGFCFPFSYDLFALVVS